MQQVEEHVSSQELCDDHRLSSVLCSIAMLQDQPQNECQQDILLAATGKTTPCVART